MFLSGWKRHSWLHGSFEKLCQRSSGTFDSGEHLQFLASLHRSHFFRERQGQKMSDVPVLKDVLVYLSTLQIDKSVIERVFGIFPSPEV